MLSICAAVVIANQGPQPAEIRFLPDSAREFAEWRRTLSGWFERPCPVTLRVNGIHALGGQTLLLYGEAAAVSTYRSVLLRSEDGGSSWAEVMSPVLGSAVIAVAFASPTVGRALVGWAIEGPGTLLAYATEDSGKTWRNLSEVTKPHSLDLPLALECSTLQRCLIHFECFAGVGETGHILETRDGGRKWGARRDVREASQTDKHLTTRAPDGSQWRVLESEDRSVLRILRRAPGEVDWSAKAFLHAEFRTSPEGDLVACAPRPER